MRRLMAVMSSQVARWRKNVELQLINKDKIAAWPTYIPFFTAAVWEWRGKTCFWLWCVNYWCYCDIKNSYSKWQRNPALYILSFYVMEIIFICLFLKVTRVMQWTQCFIWKFQEQCIITEYQQSYSGIT